MRSGTRIIFKFPYFWYRENLLLSGINPIIIQEEGRNISSKVEMEFQHTRKWPSGSGERTGYFVGNSVSVNEEPTMIYIKFSRKLSFQDRLT